LGIRSEQCGAYGYFSGYLVNVATAQQTALGTVFGRLQVTSAGRPVADDGTAVYSDFSSVAVVHGTETRHITPGDITAGNAFPMDAVIDRAGATIVFAVCASNACSLRLADPASSGSSLLLADGFAPSLSDDGKTLLYLSTRTGSTQMRVANLNGGVTLDRQLGFEIGGIALATLSGDGSTVYAVTRNGRLEKTSVATRTVQELIPRTAHWESAGTLAPGKLVAFTGGGLTDLSFTATPPLPENLNGISVTIQGTKARILSVAPDAIMAVATGRDPIGGLGHHQPVGDRACVAIAIRRRAARRPEHCTVRAGVRHRRGIRADCRSPGLERPGHRG
jgi:hypothetical protein